MNVLSDQIVRIGLSGKAANPPDHPVRLVIVKVAPHVVNGLSRGVDSDGFLRIMTNLLDVPAEMLSARFPHEGNESGNQFPHSKIRKRCSALTQPRQLSETKTLYQRPMTPCRLLISMALGTPSSTWGVCVANP